MFINIENETRTIQSGFRLDLLTSLIMCAFLFAMPINSSPKSISLVLAIGMVLFTKVNRQSLQELLNQSWVIAIIGFLALVFVECLRSPAPWNEQFFVVQKYSKLLWLPLLTLGFVDKKTRLWGLHAFIAAMFFTCIVAFLQDSHWFNIATNKPQGTVFRNYIITGHMMCLACYLVAYFAVKRPQYRMIYGVLFLLFSYEILFFSWGRTGYVVYFLLMGLLMLQVLNKKQLALGVIAVACLGYTVYHFSPRMQTGFDSFQNNIMTFKQGDRNTSIGYRLQFQKFAFQLFKERPLAGQGTGNFTYQFDLRKPIPSWPMQLREPHNQYWLIAAEYGMIGLFVYFAFLGSLFLTCRRLHEMRDIAMAVFIPFILGCFSDSLLFFSGSGYFFLGLMALCLGESLTLDKRVASVD